ncbi:hypothetical protein DKX38_026544 [Salix brachista]|uniref:Uncharacterized protein n=1 Tax=Salix brachista TaxID=2182728 RepID=A0A5N5JBQ1_9ROSI|nr:hypothetical protein DKX38_026544 [Salix brachista]
MQGQPLLDDDLSTWMDSMTGGEIFLTDENVAPGMPMPDAPETGLGTEPADQPFEMDMNNIPSSLMRDVEFSNRMTWEFTQSVAERGSSSKRPVDRSVPSSSNNEATNAASTPVRGLAIEQEEQPPLDDGLGGMDILIGGETELVEEPRAPVVLMTDEPETRQRTEGSHQSFEMNTKSISSSSMMDAVFRMCKKLLSRKYKHSVVERGSSSKSPVHKRRFLPLIACKVTVGRPSFSLLEDLNYTKSKVKEAWFYDLKIDNAIFLFKISFRKIVIVNCQNMRSLCPLDGQRRIRHCATAEAGSIFMGLNVDQKALARTLQNPCIFSSKLQSVTVGRPSFSLLEDLNYTKSKSEAWVYDLKIDNAILLSSPESLRNTIEWAIISEEPVSNPQEDALHRTTSRARCSSRLVQDMAAGSIFMGLNVDQKALAPTLQNPCIFSCKLQSVIWIFSSLG